jgi:uncharacterized protein YndB with AHSA1/START domain
MTDIHHHFLIKAKLGAVMRAVSTPEGLDTWWTKTASGSPTKESHYSLGFGPACEWQAVVTRSADSEFELQLTEADSDWMGTRVGFQLEEVGGSTQVRFHHTGWPESNEHHRQSSYCWAMYLRLLKRYVELGEVVPYEKRLDA